MNKLFCRQKTIHFSFFIFTCLAVGISLTADARSWAAWYPAQIEYQKTKGD